MNIGTFFKALLSVAESDAATTVMPAAVAAATSLAGNQSSANRILQGSKLLSVAVAAGAQIAQDEIQTLADILELEAGKLNGMLPGGVTPASAAAAAVSGPPAGTAK